MVTASGVLTLSQKKFFTNTRLICGWLVIALGGYLSFMSRPYTAVFLGILVILWASFSKKFSPKGVLLSFFAFLTLIFLTALITDGSIYGLFTRFFEAMKLEEISGAHKRFMIIAFNVGFFLNYFTLNFALLTVLIALYSLAIVLFDNKFYLTLPLFLCSPLFLIILISNYQYLLCYNCLSGYLIWIPVIIFIFYFLVKNRAKIIKPNLPLSIFFILLTVAYGLGSNNSFFITTSISAYFTLLASIIFFSSTIDSSDFPNKIIKLSALCLAITIGIIITSLGHPFRQQSILWFYSNKAPIRQGDSPLILSSNIATYLNKLHTFAERSRLKDNTPMLDLSGRNPGTIYALKGYTPKTPWIYTGYPGVNKYVFFSINKMTCEEVADMWLIYEVRLDSAPLRPEPINPNILSYFGAIFPNDYIKSETLVKHINFTNYSYLTTYQSFFKPARSKELAISKCIASKAKIGL
ncbi:MAG: hypothetical protein LBD41_03295 [Clostridiales Family XIII bacterium]|nr:hypothetical protein [Clostridiales Family XIII bacterium]